MPQGPRSVALWAGAAMMAAAGCAWAAVVAFSAPPSLAIAALALFIAGLGLGLALGMRCPKARGPLEAKLDIVVRELERSNEELEQFAYVTSHDLRQPLRAIGSYVTLLEEEVRDQLTGEARQFIDFVKDGVRRMDALIIDLLAYSRVGRMSEDKTVDTAAIVKNALTLLGPDIKEAEAVVSVAPGLPAIRGDDDEMERLFVNLIGNAVKYRSPERTPTIVIAAQDAGTRWEFQVVDNGIGIPPEHAERVFGIFQRLHARHEYDGTGVGLAICKKIVERHGGTIAVAPRPEGGTIISFTWPKA